MILLAFAMGVLLNEIMRLHDCDIKTAWKKHLNKKSSKTSPERYANFASILVEFEIVDLCKWIQCNWSDMVELKCFTPKVIKEYPAPLVVALREFGDSNLAAFR